MFVDFVREKNEEKCIEIFFHYIYRELLSWPAKVINNLAGQGKEIACDKQLKTFSHTVILGYNDQLGTGHFCSLFSGFVITWLICVVKWPILPENML